jgi:DNA-binding winged helix-turn-helix (wHTH) protein/tetratricopeptide (TPR) repeat protein
LAVSSPTLRTAAARLARFGEFELDLRAGELRRHGRRLRLQEKPLRVLVALLERAGDVVLREELRAHLWADDTFVDFDSNLNTAVSKLREVLGEKAESPRYLETLPKRGYRFLAPVEWLGAPSPAGPAPPVAPARRARRIPIARLLAAVVVAAVIGVGLYLLRGPGDADRDPLRPPSGNVAAYEAYLKGRHLARSRDSAALQRGLPHLRQAIALDPAYALAYVELSSALDALPARPREVMPEARAAALRAVEIDDTLAEAHHRLAVVHLYYDWDWEAARAEFERAVALRPDWAELRQSYAGYFSLLGRHAEALAQMRRAIQLDPVSVSINADAGWYHYVARDYEAAILQSRRALELEPDHRGAHHYILLSSIQLGRLQEALTWALRYMHLHGASPPQLAEVRAAGDEGGLQRFWRWREETLLARARSEYVAPAELALTAVARERQQEAIDLLERSYHERAGWLLPFLQVYPQLDPLRGDERFLALAARMRFPEAPKGAT